MKRLIFIFTILCSIFISCNEDNKNIIENIEEKNIEVFYGEWKLSREDNGILITTDIKINADNSCVYEQVIEKNQEDVYTITLLGSWVYNNDTSRLSFTFIDDENTEMTLYAISSDNNKTFKFDDDYSIIDDYYFEKIN